MRIAMVSEHASPLAAPDDALRRHGTAGRARVPAHYTWDRVADGVEDVHRQVLTAHTTPEEVA
jgi:D-inositol-3-phosphate glycosyltransferase